MIVDLENASNICATKNGWYWQHRPGTAKAYDKVSMWLDWNRRAKARKTLLDKGIDEAVVEGGCYVGEEPIIDKWACDKLLSAVKNQINELHSPKHNIGEMRWWRDKNEKKLALISGSPIIVGGDVKYPCLVDGNLVEVTTKDLFKRR